MAPSVVSHGTPGTPRREDGGRIGGTLWPVTSEHFDLIIIGAGSGNSLIVPEMDDWRIEGKNRIMRILTPEQQKKFERIMLDMK